MIWRLVALRSNGVYVLNELSNVTFPLLFTWRLLKVAPKKLRLNGRAIWAVEPSSFAARVFALNPPRSRIAVAEAGAAPTPAKMNADKIQTAGRRFNRDSPLAMQAFHRSVLTWPSVARSGCRCLPYLERILGIEVGYRNGPLGYRKTVVPIGRIRSVVSFRPLARPDLPTVPLQERAPRHPDLPDLGPAPLGKAAAPRGMVPGE